MRGATHATDWLPVSSGRVLGCARPSNLDWPDALASDDALIMRLAPQRRTALTPPCEADTKHPLVGKCARTLYSTCADVNIFVRVEYVKRGGSGFGETEATHAAETIYF